MFAYISDKRVKMTEYVIFKEGTTEEILQKMLKLDYMPLNVSQIWNLTKDSRILAGAYSTRTVFIDGNIRDATFEELDNIKEFYEKGGRLFVVCYGDDSGFELEAHNLLGCVDCFIGTHPDAKVLLKYKSPVPSSLEQVLALGKNISDNII